MTNALPLLPWAAIDVRSLSADYGEGDEDFGKFFRREIAPRLGLDGLIQDDRMAFHPISEAMENLSAYTVLQLLARNPHAASLPVQWAFNDIDTGGYARREDLVRTLDPRKRFLIVTEGSSDAAILRHALNLLRRILPTSSTLSIWRKATPSPARAMSSGSYRGS
jgi:hypothetical protein